MTAPGWRLKENVSQLFIKAKNLVLRIMIRVTIRMNPTILYIRTDIRMDKG